MLTFTNQGAGCDEFQQVEPDSSNVCSTPLPLVDSLLILLFCSFSSPRRLKDFLSPRSPAFSPLVSILDLDPKPFDSIPCQLRLDQRIVSFYLRTGAALPKGSLPPLPAIFTAVERDDRTLLFHPV